MWKYILKRILISIVTLLTILCILFLVLQFMPGSPFNDEKLSADQIAVLYAKYGLDQPVPVQFVRYVKNMLSGDFGVSYVIQQNMPISQMLSKRLLISGQIGIQAMIVGIIFGLLLGLIAAVNHNRPLDTAATFFSLLGASIPSYVFALGLSYFLAFKLKLFPLLYTNKQAFQSTILPTIALGMSPIASIARFSRTEMLEELNSEYIRLAEAKGIGSVERILVHALRNAMIPILTIMGPMLVSLMTGSTVIETIFTVPGVGSLFVNAIQANDYNVIIALAFVFSAMYIGVMLIVDILYGIIDPRIRLSGDSGKRKAGRKQSMQQEGERA
jgi:oligopeptide transport system permease protein